MLAKILWNLTPMFKVDWDTLIVCISIIEIISAYVNRIVCFRNLCYRNKITTFIYKNAFAWRISSRLFSFITCLFFRPVMFLAPINYGSWTILEFVSNWFFTWWLCTMVKIFVSYFNRKG